MRMWQWTVASERNHVHMPGTSCRDVGDLSCNLLNQPVTLAEVYHFHGL